MKNIFVHAKAALALLSFLLFSMLICASFAFADTGIVVNNSRVTINTTYRGDVNIFLSAGYPKIRLLSTEMSLVSDNESGNASFESKALYMTSLRTSNNCPKVSGFVSLSDKSNVTCSFVTRADLLSGRYTYYIMVEDMAGNMRSDEKNFTVELPVVPLDENCYNNLTDGTETDRNCGGKGCLCCEAPKMCKNDTDCCSNYCRQGFCAEPRCDDLMRNGFESDVDCGGTCPGCPEGKNCKSDSDCITGFCDARGICDFPTCDDGSKNGFESDVDCGGTNCSKCANGMSCISPADCESDFCEAGYCACDNSKDTDGDRMPDCWELKYNLDPNNPDDAEEDLDGDGISNLDEYLDRSDPTDPTDPFQEKSHLLGIILLILGLLLMGGSTGFLIYSRKVLVPKERLNRRAQQPAGASSAQQGQRPIQPGGIARPGQVATNQLSNRGSSVAQALAQRRLSQQQGAKPGAASATAAGPKPGFKQAASDNSDGYVSLSELGKNKDKDKGNKNDDKAKYDGDKKEKPKNDGTGKQVKLSSVFERLKELTSQNNENRSSGKEKEDQKDNKDKK